MGSVRVNPSMGKAGRCHHLLLFFSGRVCMVRWYVYMIRCGDGTLYTGTTTDVDRRFAEHQASGPRAARYLRGRGPLQLVLTVEAGDRGAALRLEHRIKGLPRAQKETLIQRPESLREIVGAALM